MSKIIKLCKGLDIRLQGEAAKTIVNAPKASEYAVSPLDFEGVTPKMLVKVGDKVEAGSPLFFDKKRPEILFTSPVSGTVAAVNRGEKRKILSVVVAADAENTYKSFSSLDLATASREQIIELLLESGLWTMFVQRPYGVVANPSDKPKAIFVSAFNSMPLSQDFSYVVKGQEEEFKAGIKALSAIAKVNLGINVAQSKTFLNDVPNCEVTVFDGPAPAGNVGVQINHVDPINKGEVVWTIAAEEVIFVGRLMKTGRVDLTRTIAVAGSEVKKPAYATIKVGQKLDTLLQGQISDEASLRIINGNVMTGIKTSKDGYLAAHATEVNVIPEGDHADEFMGWIMPRFNTFSTHRSYISWLFGKKKEYVFDARVKGGERHMIMSGEYDKVFPMDIYAGYLIKAIITGDIDRQEALGIYEVAPEDFAIAEFVCSSKLELQRIVREGLDILKKENA